MEVSRLAAPCNAEAAPPKLLLLPTWLLQPPRQQTMERDDAASPAEASELIPAAQNSGMANAA